MGLAAFDVVAGDIRSRRTALASEAAEQNHILRGKAFPSLQPRKARLSLPLLQGLRPRNAPEEN